MLASRGQENLLQTRPNAGKTLQPKTPGQLQTPRNANRAPLGAKTTNAKAQTVHKDQKNAKFQVFKTPAPGQQQQHQIKPEQSVNKPRSTIRRSGRSRIEVATPKAVDADLLAQSHDEDDEPEYGYAPPPITELPDPPLDFDFKSFIPQFQPEDIFRNYGQIFHLSPRDEDGFSIRQKKEEQEHRQWMMEEERAYTERIKKAKSKKWVLEYDLTDEDESDQDIKSTAANGKTVPATTKANRAIVKESKPDVTKSKLAVSALSSMTTNTIPRLPSAATKQTASSRLKMSKPSAHQSKANFARTTTSSTAPTATTSSSRPTSTAKTTIGFPRAKAPPSIIPQKPIGSTEPQKGTSVKKAFYNYDDDEVDALADELSDFEFQLDFDDGEIFQLPMPED